MGLIPQKLKRWNMNTFSLELLWWLSACHEMKQEGNTGQMEVVLCEKPGSWESKRITGTFPQDSTDPKYKLKTYASSLLLLLLLQLCTVSISLSDDIAAENTQVPLDHWNLFWHSLVVMMKCVACPYHQQIMLCGGSLLITVLHMSFSMEKYLYM